MTNDSAGICLTDDFVNRWEDIISSIDIKDVPLQYIKHLIVTTSIDEEIVIGVQDLVEEQGVDIKDLELIIDTKIQQLSDDIKCISYILDIEKISNYIQTKTDATLNIIKKD